MEFKKHNFICDLIKKYYDIVYELLNILNSTTKEYSSSLTLQEALKKNQKDYDIYIQNTKPTITYFELSTDGNREDNEKKYNFKQQLINIIIKYGNIKDNIITIFNKLQHNSVNIDKLKFYYYGIYDYNKIKNETNFLKTFEQVFNIKFDPNFINISNILAYINTIKFKTDFNFDDTDIDNIKQEISKIKKSLIPQDLKKIQDFILKKYIKNIELSNKDFINDDIKKALNHLILNFNHLINKTSKFIKIQDLILSILIEYLENNKITNIYLNHLFDINNLIENTDFNDLIKEKKKIEIKPPVDNNDIVLAYNFKIEHIIQMLIILLLRDKEELERDKLIETEDQEKLDNELELINIINVTDFLTKLNELNEYIYINNNDKFELHFKKIKIKKINEEQKTKLKNICNLVKSYKLIKSQNPSQKLMILLKALSLSFNRIKDILFDGDDFKEEFQILFSQ